MNGSWTHDELQRCLTQKQQWVKSKTNQNPNEAATKNACIEPILRALGWDPSDDEEVVPEWGKSQAAGRADYALITEHGGHPIAVLEAKSLTTTISDKDVTQTLQYAQLQQVTWAIVTNGSTWRLYDALKQAQWNERLVWSIHIEDFDAAEKLSQIAKSELPGLKDRLEHIQDAVVLKAVLERLFRHPTAEFVALLGKESGLPAKRIREVMGQPALSGSFSGSAPLPEASVSQPAPRRGRPKKVQQEVLEPAAIDRAKITGRKPTSFSIGNQSFEVRSWRDVWTTAAEHVLLVNPKAFARAAESDEFSGRLRRTIGADPSVMRSAYPIGRFFIEVNLSSQHIASLTERLVAFALPGNGFDYTLVENIY